MIELSKLFIRFYLHDNKWHQYCINTISQHLNKFSILWMKYETEYVIKLLLIYSFVFTESLHTSFVL